jgi:hypothetical protein
MKNSFIYKKKKNRNRGVQDFVVMLFSVRFMS